MKVPLADESEKVRHGVKFRVGETLCFGRAHFWIIIYLFLAHFQDFPTFSFTGAQQHTSAFAVPSFIIIRCRWVCDDDTCEQKLHSTGKKKRAD